MWRQEDEKFKVILSYIASEGSHEIRETSLSLRNKEPLPKSHKKEWVALSTEVINRLLIS